MNRNRWAQSPCLHRIVLTVLPSVLSTMVVFFTITSPVLAASYSLKGEFDEGFFHTGIAVDQKSGDVYVGSYTSGEVDKFDGAGNAIAQPFISNGGYDFGVAVDPENQNLYVYDAKTMEIETYTSAGTSVSSGFKVQGSLSFAQIASGPQGDVYYPDKSENKVLRYSPSGVIEETIEGQGPVGAFSEPIGVAVDSAGNVYVVDAGNKRLVRVEAGTGTESVIDTAGTRDVAVDPETGDVFALDLNAEGSCGPLTSPCYVVRAFHRGQTTSFAEFGRGTIGFEIESVADHLAVDHETGDVYVAEFGYSKQRHVLTFVPATPPTVTTGPANVMVAQGPFGPELSVALNGIVNPEGSPTSYLFQWGMSTSYGEQTPEVCVVEGLKRKNGECVTGVQEESVRGTVSGLEGSTTYDYRLVAEANGSSFPGRNESFTTPAVGPLVQYGPPSAVSQSEVTLNGTVDPENQPTTWTFEYGTSPSYTFSMPVLGGNAGAESSAQPVSVTLTGLRENTVYHYSLAAKNGTATTEAPDQTFITLPPFPRATTEVASGISHATATLDGSITPGSVGPNSDTTWLFEYGTSDSYSESAPKHVDDAGMGTEAVAVSAALEGLASNTTYHYRLVASNDNSNPLGAPQSAQGRDQTFTTLPVEPLAGQTSAGSSAGEVMLQGHINPTGHPLQYRFEYGPTTTYGSSTSLDSAGEGTEYAQENAKITSLAPGTYHWRVAAVGVGGTVYSLDATFTVYGPAPAPVPNPFTPGTSSAEAQSTISLLSIPSFLTPPKEAAKPPTRKPRLSCRTKAKRIKNPGKREAALKRCTKTKRKGKSSRGRKSTKSRDGHHR